MSQILKTFMGLFLILIMIATSVGLLSSFFSVMAAQNLHAAMISEIEDSDYYPIVIKECFQIANEKGYDLEMTLYGEDNSIKECTCQSDVPTDVKMQMAKVTLKVNTILNFFGRNDEHILDGYAR